MSVSKTLRKRLDFLQVFGHIGFKTNIALWVILDSLHLYLPYLALQQYTATGWCTVLHYYITSLELTLPGNAVAYLLEMLRVRTTAPSPTISCDTLAHYYKVIYIGTTSPKHNLYSHCTLCRWKRETQ